MITPERLAEIEASEAAYGMSVAEQRELVRGYREAEVLTAENERLRTALAEKLVSETTLSGLSGTGLTLGVEGGAARLLAASFAEQFKGSGAINYLEVTFTATDIGKLVVTMQRVDGKTPHQLRGEAEARADRLAVALRNLLDDTQHTNHGCGDEDHCPVTAARDLLAQEPRRD